MMRKSHAERRKTMENMGNKKLALLYILKILEEYSDRDHPMTQSDIAEKLEVTDKVILDCAKELQKKYSDDCGINLLIFN